MIRKEENFKEILEILYRKHKNKIVVISLATLVVCVFLILTLTATREDTEMAVSEKENTTENVEANTDTFVATEKVTDQKVYITGEVNAPGVYNITTGDRIEDIISYAGGLTDKANVNYVNLAEIVSDEQHVVIPNVDDEVVVTKEAIQNSSNKININKADKTELMQIKGVGEVTAQNIIDYRENYGKYKNIEDLKNVEGIGDKTFEKLKNQIDIK